MTRVPKMFDVTAVPKGPKGEFPRQLNSQFNVLIAAYHKLQERVLELEVNPVAAAGTSAPVGYFPRVKANNTIDDPYQITWDEIGTAFDDTGWDGPATEPTVFYLPDSATFAAEFDLANNYDRSPWFLFHRTQGYDLYICSLTDDVIAVDLTDQSSAGSSDGNVVLTSGNSSIALRLMDNAWRAYAITGTWEIDKALPP